MDELRLTHSNVCPTCGQVVSQKGEPRRICARCQKPIRRRHRWMFANGQVLHRNCQTPEEA
jgi:predicted amidophosphoribosyltransferase